MHIREPGKCLAVRFNVLLTTAAAYQHRRQLIQRQLFEQPAELIGQFPTGDALRMFSTLMLIAADRDDNDTGQLKSEEAAKACGGKASLPPVTGD
ncbi:hypothetical protein, partial [Pantoea ananatis]|uniref:hypothetical protein n=1 Tax=Pantoea ananas TaxID=553 RepID=UPI001FF0B134